MSIKCSSKFVCCYVEVFFVCKHLIYLRPYGSRPSKWSVSRAICDNIEDQTNNVLFKDPFRTVQ